MCFFVQDRRSIHPTNDAVFSKVLFVRTGFRRRVPFGSFQRFLPQFCHCIPTVDTPYDYTIQESLERLFVGGSQGLGPVLFSLIVIGSDDEFI